MIPKIKEICFNALAVFNLPDFYDNEIYWETEQQQNIYDPKNFRYDTSSFILLVRRVHKVCVNEEREKVPYKWN